MANIFVSYSRVDKAFTERFVTRLRRLLPDGVVWYDDELHGGDVWWDEILNRVAACDIFIYLLSNESVRSPYCQAEFTEARRLQKRVITVQVRDRTELTDELDDIQYIDMKAGVDDADAVARLSGAVRLQLAKAQKKRPLWQPRTPKPGLVRETPRPANDPDVDTPALQSVQPAPPPPAAPGIFTQILVGLFVTVVGGVIIALILGQLPIGGGGAATPTTAAQIASATTEPPFDPSSLVALTHTREAEQTQAALPTITPTATTDFQATVDAVATATRAHVQTVEAERVLQITADAAAPLTAQPTLDPYARAANFSGTNTDWTPFEQDFDGVPMMLVPARCFMMGSETGEEDEKPAHEICFDEPFWIDQTEVTQAQFAQWGGVVANSSRFDGEQRPVEQITWFEARDFCAKRGARLPTEAEWEYAARGPDGWAYPWGNEWDENKAVWNRSSEQGTANVGSIPAGASWVGVVDMSGNVYEWVSSLDQPYPYNEEDGREVDTVDLTSSDRVTRGGSWGGTVFKGYSTTSRNNTIPTTSNSYYGFRCARSM